MKTGAWYMRRSDQQGTLENYFKKSFKHAREIVQNWISNEIILKHFLPPSINLEVGVSRHPFNVFHDILFIFYIDIIKYPICLLRDLRICVVVLHSVQLSSKARDGKFCVNNDVLFTYRHQVHYQNKSIFIFSLIGSSKSPDQSYLEVHVEDQY